MAIRGSFKLTGVEEYLKKINEAGNNIDNAVKEAIKESAQPILEDMKAGAERHKRTGAVVEAVEVTEIKQDGNFIYVEIGVNEEKAKAGAWHAVFQEYGSPTFEKDPFIRPAFDNNKNDVKKIQRKVLKKWGVPIK
jgi:HK97 gp10 family phage protein